MAAPTVIDIAAQIAMDGTEKTYTVPSNITSIVIHAKTAAIDMLRTSGSSTDLFQLAQDTYLTLQDRNLAGLEIYFKAASGTIEILESYGSLS